MTLDRLNPTRPVPVIDRTDDSGADNVRVAVLGQRDLFGDVLIEAMRHAGFTAWWAGAEGDDPIPEDADLVVLSLGTAGYSTSVRRLVRRLAAADLLAITIDGAASPPPGRSWIAAGAIWAVDPAVTSIDDLVATIEAAVAHRTAGMIHRRRSDSAEDAWVSAHESSILTMRDEPVAAEHAVDPRVVEPRADNDLADDLGGGDVGRQH
jgi:methylmalonyl-CoA mutase cobalamin-binding subunit